MQRTTIIIVTLLFALAPSIGIIIGLTWHNQAPTYNPSAISDLPAPTSSTKGVSVSYSELSRTEIGSNTRVVLSLSITLTGGSSVTLDYSQFTLSAFVVRGGLLPAGIGVKYAEVRAQGTGAVTVNSNNPTSTFQLTFEFPTEGKNFDDYFRHFSYYEIDYSSSYDNPINIEWLNQ